MDDMTTQSAPTTVPEAPATLQIQVISELKPWATVLSGENQGLRPMDIDEIVTVPANEAQMLKRNRHAVILNS
jgi:hypothetical protein